MRIVIAGGGVVGLTLAGLLARRGLSPAVIERMPGGQYVKRGFMLGCHGHDALAELELLCGVRERGTVIGPQPDGACAAIGIEVGWLLQRLEDGIEVLHEHTVSALRWDSTGRVAGVVADGPGGPVEMDADLVVACDGMYSRVRQMAGLQAIFTPLAEGKIEWMSPVPLEEPFAMAYTADGGHIGAFSWPEGSFGWRMTDRVGREAALAPGLDALKESFRRLLPASEAGVNGLTDIAQVRYDEPELLSCPWWWTPGLALVGDAAHFFGPETGAPAGIGMADAHALAQAVANYPGDPDAACRSYVTWREPAVRPMEALDPSRRRTRDTPLPQAREDERWPPRAGTGHAEAAATV